MHIRKHVGLPLVWQDTACVSSGDVDYQMFNRRELEMHVKTKNTSLMHTWDLQCYIRLSKATILIMQTYLIETLTN